MRLAEFIINDMEAILVEWESFAATLFPGGAGTPSLTLRDHAKEILSAVAKDLRTSQTKQARDEKSKGEATKVTGAPDTAAETHAVLRAKSGFDINQLVAEYRALRASVLGLWMDARKLDQFDPLDLADIVRFNEAIDQAIAESITFFSDERDQARNLLLGMLGHDMRSPLNTIQLTASYLEALNAGDEVSLAASRLLRSGASMKALLDDLVDFSRTKLGLGINVTLADAVLTTPFANEVDQLRGAHPDRQIELQVVGNTRGRWDAPRLQQLLRNLVSNAIKYGARGTPVRVMVTGDNADVRLEVTNTGPPIEGEVMGRLFNPLQRGPAQEDGDNDDRSLGLGLYIVREIALAHGGEVSVRSDKSETVFAVRLPRRNEDVSP